MKERREWEREVEMAERKGVETGGGRGREGGRERGLVVLGVNGRSARLTNIKMCSTGDAE